MAFSKKEKVENGANSVNCDSIACDLILKTNTKYGSCYSQHFNAKKVFFQTLMLQNRSHGARGLLSWPSPTNLMISSLPLLSSRAGIWRVAIRTTCSTMKTIWWNECDASFHYYETDLRCATECDEFILLLILCYTIDICVELKVN